MCRRLRHWTGSSTATVSTSGIAIPEGVEVEQWKLDRISKAGAHLMGRVTYQRMSSYVGDAASRCGLACIR